MRKQGYLKAMHKKCREVLRVNMFDTQNATIACKIYDELIDCDGFTDNSIGENLNRLLYQLDKDWYKSYCPKSSTNNEFYFYTSIFWLYLFQERMEVVLHSVYDKRNDLDKKELKEIKDSMPAIFGKIKIWCNFVKHPKEFLFTHFTWFVFEDENVIIPEEVNRINFDTIKSHYEYQDKPRPIQFENSYNNCIILPKLDELMQEFCDDFKVFINTVCNNNRIKNTLINKSSMEFYQQS